MTEERRVLLIGNSNPIHIGAHFFHASRSLQLSAEICDVKYAYEGSWASVKYNWWIRSRRPPKLNEFSQFVLEKCKNFKPKWIIATGICPIMDWALAEIGALGIVRINFLTDDPWNPAHRSTWFMNSIPEYDKIFTPRKANIESLKSVGCRNVIWLPFAYAPEIHYPEIPTVDDAKRKYLADIVFVGGADKARLKVIAALIQEGFTVSLYGGYWNRYRQTRESWRGYAEPSQLRRAMSEAKIALCLVRSANRDGNSMRSFEIPAMGACALMEYTEEHQSIFGDEGAAVRYFSSTDEMIDKARWLLNHDDERKRLAESAYLLITQGNNAYSDRLKQLIA